MIAKLEKSQYARIQQLFHELRYSLVVDSILEGNTPAWVYADNPARPKSAMIWNKRDVLLVAGDSNNDRFNQDFSATVLEEIIPDARAQDISVLFCQYDPKAWKTVISQSLNVLEGSRALRRYYNFDRPQLDWHNRVPSGHQMLPIDAPLLENSNLKQTHQLIGWIESFWRTSNDFLDRGFGYCLIKENEILSWCISAYASGKDYELRVATHPSYGDIGFATLVSAACVEHCNQHELTPHWHCWNDDLASISVAERVGFENPVKYPVFRLKL